MELNNPDSRFFDFLLKINQPYMINFERWVFYPGMLFNSLDKWWGDKKERKTPHEGIDLCYFKEKNGKISRLHKDIKIPGTFSGSIVKIDDDFLGKSIFLGHNVFSKYQRQLYTVYGHTEPLDSIKAMKEIEAGEIIATIAACHREGIDIHPHLHITFAWVPASINVDHLNWQTLTSNPEIMLIDPLLILSSATKKRNLID
jgi:hypothetical protein